MFLCVLVSFLVTSLCVLHSSVDASVLNKWRDPYLNTPSPEEFSHSSLGNIRQKRSEPLTYLDGLLVTVKSARREALPNGQGARFTVVFEKNVDEPVQVYWNDDHRGTFAWLVADVESIDGGLNRATVDSLWIDPSRTFNHAYFFFASTHADNDLFIQLFDYSQTRNLPESDTVEERLNIPEISLSPTGDAFYQQGQNVDVFIRTTIPDDSVFAQAYILNHNQDSLSKVWGWEDRQLKIQKINQTSEGVNTLRARFYTYRRNYYSGVMEIAAYLDRRFDRVFSILTQVYMRKVKNIIPAGSSDPKPFPDGFAKFLKDHHFYGGYDSEGAQQKKCYTDSSSPSTFACILKCPVVGDDIGDIDMFRQTPEGAWDPVEPFAATLPEFDQPLSSLMPGTWYKARRFRIAVTDDLLGQEVHFRCETRNGTGGLDTLNIKVNVKSF